MRCCSVVCAGFGCRLLVELRLFGAFAALGHGGHGPVPAAICGVHEECNGAGPPVVERCAEHGVPVVGPVDVVFTRQSRQGLPRSQLSLLHFVPPLFFLIPGGGGPRRHGGACCSPRRRSYLASSAAGGWHVCHAIKPLKGGPSNTNAGVVTCAQHANSFVIRQVRRTAQPDQS